MIWFHGGGWVTGSVDSHTSFCAQVAGELDLPVVLVDYRLSPEAPFPAAHEDAEASTRWVATSPAVLGREVTSVIPAGDSAGGTMAITTALALRENPSTVPVSAHLAIYPATDETRVYPSQIEFASGYLLTQAGKDWYRKHHQPDPNDWRVRPRWWPTSPALLLASC